MKIDAISKENQLMKSKLDKANMNYQSLLQKYESKHDLINDDLQTTKETNKRLQSAVKELENLVEQQILFWLLLSVEVV